MLALVRSARFEDVRAIGRGHAPADLAMVADHRSPVRGCMAGALVRSGDLREHPA